MITNRKALPTTSKTLSIGGSIGLRVGLRVYWDAIDWNGIERWIEVKVGGYVLLADKFNERNRDQARRHLSILLKDHDDKLLEYLLRGLSEVEL
jgi:hypothetical protein